MNNMSTVRSLAERYSYEQLDACLQAEISGGINRCVDRADRDIAIDLLARAGQVRQLLDGGMVVNEAMRELGRRMRQIIN
jgi:hypothetical protein